MSDEQPIRLARSATMGDMTEPASLIEFYAARLDEATDATQGRDVTAVELAVFRDIAAKRVILTNFCRLAEAPDASDLHRGKAEGARYAVLALALAHRDHPDWRWEWV